MMKIVEDCLRSVVPAHWITEVEASACDVNMLAYPSKDSRYTLVVGAWAALLLDGREVPVEGFASFADLIDSLELTDRTVADDVASVQLSLEF